MRTTLMIDDDVLVAANALAKQQGKSVGAVISDLARQSLRHPSSRRERNVVQLLPARNPGAVVTLRVVNPLRDERA